jgi:hypothetical protein
MIQYILNNLLLLLKIIITLQFQKEKKTFRKSIVDQGTKLLWIVIITSFMFFFFTQVFFALQFYPFKLVYLGSNLIFYFN